MEKLDGAKELDVGRGGPASTSLPGPKADSTSQSQDQTGLRISALRFHLSGIVFPPLLVRQTAWWGPIRVPPLGAQGWRLLTPTSTNSDPGFVDSGLVCEV